MRTRWASRLLDLLYPPECALCREPLREGLSLCADCRLELPRLSCPVIPVCSLSGKGMDELKDAVQQLFWRGEINAESLQVMINARHQDALRRTREAAEQALEGIRSERELELVAMDLRMAVNAVGEIVGKTATDDILDSIFSQFCLGK